MVQELQILLQSQRDLGRGVGFGVVRAQQGPGHVPSVLCVVLCGVEQSSVVSVEW